VMRVRLGELLLDPCVVASSALVSSSLIGSESTSSAKNALRRSKELVGAVEVMDIVVNEVEVAEMKVLVLRESNEGLEWLSCVICGENLNGVLWSANIVEEVGFGVV
jgi:hypothetical protein